MTQLVKPAIALVLAAQFAFGSAVLSSATAQESQDEMKAMMEVHKKMVKTMQNMKPTGDADKDFVMMMIPHHQGAIEMAEIELKYGKDTELRQMAEQIIESQKKEIEEMKKWQKDHGM